MCYVRGSGSLEFSQFLFKKYHFNVVWITFGTFLRPLERIKLLSLIIYLKLLNCSFLSALYICKSNFNHVETLAYSSFPSDLDEKKGRLSFLSLLGCATDCNLNFVKRRGLINLKILNFLFEKCLNWQCAEQTGATSSSSLYLFIYQVTSYHKKKLQLPLGLSPKHRNMQFF